MSEHDQVGVVNILLVDDNAANLLALDATLRQERYHLIHASSGERALAILETTDVALVLLDVQMPGIDGYETARRIKAMPRHAQTPIAFISAIFTEDAHVRAGYDAGGVDYFAKPINTELLRVKVGIYAELYEKNLSLRLREKNAAIRDAELRAVLESIPDAVYVGDTGGITRCNAAAVELFGFEAGDELKKKPLGEIAARVQMRRHPSGALIPQDEQPFFLALRGERVSTKVLIENLRTHEDRVLAVAAAPIHYDDAIIGAIVVNTDVTQDRSTVKQSPANRPAQLR